MDLAILTIHALRQTATEVDEKEFAVSLSSDDIGALEVFVIEFASFQVGGQTNDFERDVQEQLLVAHAVVIYCRPEIDTFDIRHQKTLNEPILADDGGQVRYSRCTRQFFVIFDLGFEAVLVATGSNKFVDKLLLTKRD